jgi:hypothetical protein
MRDTYGQASHIPVDLDEVDRIGGAEAAHKSNQCAENSCADATHGIKPDTYQLTWVRLAV